MKKYSSIYRVVVFALVFSMFSLSTLTIYAKRKNVQEPESYTTFRGKVVDSKSLTGLVFATVAVEGTNIATVTNSEGKFIIKIPVSSNVNKIKITFIGYKTLEVNLNELKKDKSNLLKLEPASVEISEVNVFPNDPRILINKVMSMRGENYMDEPVLMTAFYRETIQKRKSYVGLSEAVVQVYKQSYSNFREDQVKLFKGRKNANTQKLDTLLFKLQGGPNSTLSLDIVKNPYIILEEGVLELYEYKITNITRVDGKLNYVIDFKQKPDVTQPLFYGKIYIDIDQLAISSISFNLNTTNRVEASQMFIKKKPMGVSVHPTSANYIVNYREQDGKWLYNYARGEVTFKVKWKKRLFNNVYTTMVEMAATDWEKAEDKPFKSSDRLKMNVVMSEAITGFADKEFWGDYNIIEPEQSIESAIKKIHKNLSKIK